MRNSLLISYEILASARSEMCTFFAYLMASSIIIYLQSIPTLYPMSLAVDAILHHLGIRAEVMIFSVVAASIRHVWLVILAPIPYVWLYLFILVLMPCRGQKTPLISPSLSQHIFRHHESILKKQSSCRNCNCSVRSLGRHCIVGGHIAVAIELSGIEHVVWLPIVTREWDSVLRPLRCGK